MSLEVPTASVSRSDITIQFFDKVFGPDWEHLANLVERATGVQHDAIPSMIFKIAGVYNSICIMCLGLLWVWILAQAAVGTARDGQPMGAKFHTFWVPVRIAYSASMLAPVAKGLCFAQLIVLSCIGFSIQFANMVWDAGINFLQENAGQVMLASPTQLQDQSKLLASGVLKSLTIRTYSEYQQGYTYPNQLYVFESSALSETDNTSSVSLKFTVPTMSPEGKLGLTNGDIGIIKYTCKNDSYSVCSDRQGAINEMIETLYPVAERIGNGQGVSRTELWQALESVSHTYSLRMAGALRNSRGEAQKDLQQQIDKFTDSATSRGWAMAGSYYWTISRLTEKSSEGMRDEVKYVEPNQRKYGRGMESSFRGIDTSLDDLAVEQLDAAGAGADINFIKKFFNQAGYGLVNLSADWAEGKDIVASLANYGQYIIGLGEVAVVSMTGIIAKLTAVKTWTSSSVIGQVADFTGAGSSITSGLLGVFNFSSPAIWTLFCALFVCGFFFAYYLPAVPFVLWITGVVKWIVVVVEALVATPFWIVMHSMPEGEGIAGERAQQGYGLLMSILLRPPLMVTGLLFSYVMLQGLGKLIGYTYQVYHASAHAETTMGIAHIIATLVIFGGLMVITSHTIFGLVKHLPEKVIQWVNSRTPGLDDGSEEARLRVMGGGVASKVEQVMGTGGRASMHRKQADTAGKADGKQSAAAETDFLPGEMRAHEKKGDNSF